MAANRSHPGPTVVPVLTCPDIRAAVHRLTEAFGFRELTRIGEAHRSQMRVGAEGAVSVADASHARRAPDPGHGETHSVMVRVADAHAHCEHARAHGAQIVAEPEDFPFGERQYRAQDLAGHRWTFSQTPRDVAPEEWGGETVST